MKFQTRHPHPRYRVKVSFSVVFHVFHEKPCFILSGRLIFDVEVMAEIGHQDRAGEQGEDLDTIMKIYSKKLEKNI